MLIFILKKSYLLINILALLRIFLSFKKNKKLINIPKNK